MLDEGDSQLTQVRSNVDLPGGVIKRPGLGESSKPYKEEAAVERVKELSVRASQEEDKEKEDEELDLVLGELVKIINDSDARFLGGGQRKGGQGRVRSCAWGVGQNHQRFRGLDTRYRTRYTLQCNNQTELSTRA